jgi:hypothetical protein
MRQRRRFLLAVVLTALPFSADLVHVQSQAFTFERGDRVREKLVSPPAGPERTGMVVTVVAQPGDAIEIKENRILVNGQPIAGFSPELVAMVVFSKQVPGKVPANQYLVMGEAKDPLNNIVRKWGLYFGTALEPAGD